MFHYFESILITNLINLKGSEKFLFFKLINEIKKHLEITLA